MRAELRKIQGGVGGVEKHRCKEYAMQPKVQSQIKIPCYKVKIHSRYSVLYRRKDTSVTETRTIIKILVVETNLQLNWAL